MKQKGRLVLKPLQSGQVWKMNDANLEIQEVGKLLVHYRLCRPNAKRVPISLSGKEAVEKYLKENRATLVRRKSTLVKPMKAKSAVLLFLACATLLLPGCIAFPPLIQVEHKEPPNKHDTNAELMRRLDSIDQRLDQLERKPESK